MGWDLTVMTALGTGEALTTVVVNAPDYFESVTDRAQIMMRKRAATCASTIVDPLWGIAILPLPSGFILNNGNDHGSPQFPICSFSKQCLTLYLSFGKVKHFDRKRTITKSGL